MPSPHSPEAEPSQETSEQNIRGSELKDLNLFAVRFIDTCKAA